MPNVSALLFSCFFCLKGGRGAGAGAAAAAEVPRVDAEEVPEQESEVSDPPEEVPEEVPVVLPEAEVTAAEGPGGDGMHMDPYGYRYQSLIR